MSPLPPRFLKRDSSSFDLCTVVKMLQFYARVVVELELRYVQRPFNIIGARELVVQLAAIFLGIYTRRMHGIVGERERSNCVVDLRCI